MSQCLSQCLSLQVVAYNCLMDTYNSLQIYPVVLILINYHSVSYPTFVALIITIKLSITVVDSWNTIVAILTTKI